MPGHRPACRPDPLRGRARRHHDRRGGRADGASPLPAHDRRAHLHGRVLDTGERPPDRSRRRRSPLLPGRRRHRPSPGGGSGRRRRCRPGRHRGGGQPPGGRRGDEDGDRHLGTGERPGPRRLRRPQRAGRRRRAVVPDRTRRRRRCRHARDGSHRPHGPAGGPGGGRWARSGPGLRPRLRRHDLRRPPPAGRRRSFGRRRAGDPRRLRRSLRPRPRAPRPGRRHQRDARIPGAPQHVPAIARCRARGSAAVVQRPTAAGALPLRVGRARPEPSARGCVAAHLRRPAAARGAAPDRGGTARGPAVVDRAARDAGSVHRVDPAALPGDRRPGPRGPVQPLRPSAHRSIAGRGLGHDEAARRRAPRIDRRAARADGSARGLRAAPPADPGRGEPARRHGVARPPSRRADQAVLQDPCPGGRAGGAGRPGRRVPRRVRPRRPHRARRRGPGP